MKLKHWLFLLLALAALALAACGKQAKEWQEQYDLGAKYLSEGNYQEAILAFSAVIEIEPKAADAYVGRADAYIGAAVELADGGITPGTEQSQQILSYLQNAEADYQTALNLVEEGCELSEDPGVVQQKLAETSERKEQVLEQEEAAAQAETMDVSDTNLEPEEMVLSRDEQYRINIFLSNFSEQWFHEYDIYDSSNRILEKFESENADPMEIVRFACIYAKLNQGMAGEYIQYKDMTYCGIAIDVVSSISERFFGKSIVIEDIQPIRTAGFENYIAVDDKVCCIPGDGATYNHMTIAKKMYDLGNGTAQVDFYIYSINDEEIAPITGTIQDKSVYYYTSEEAASHASFDYYLSGTAVVKPYTTDSGKETYQLISYELYEEEMQESKEETPAEPAENEGTAALYTQYLLNGGYEKLAIDTEGYPCEVDREHLEVSSCLIDLDGDGIEEALIRMTDTAVSGPQGYPVYDAYLDIQDGNVIPVATACWTGGTMGGDSLEIVFDQINQEYVLCFSGYRYYSMISSNNRLMIYESNNYEIKLVLEEQRLIMNAGQYDTSIPETIKRVQSETSLYEIEDDFVFIFRQMNGEYVSKNDYDSARSRFVTPTDSKYQLKEGGTYENPFVQ